MRTFPGMNQIPEGADLFQGVEINGPSNVVGIMADTSLMVAPTAGSYTVMGGNKSANAADMQPVPDIYNNSGARSLQTPFISGVWAFRYMGIQYTNGGTVTVTGKVTFTIETKAQSTNLS